MAEPMTLLDGLRMEMLGSLRSYTMAMFREQYGRSFALGNHHGRLFAALQSVLDGRCRRLIINMPPRYSKTEVAVKAFAGCGFALNPRSKFLHLSYSDTLVQDNSRAVREAMCSPLYKELFPWAALQREKGSSKRWRTAAGGEFYAVSTQGQVTGFGAGLVDTEESDRDYSSVSDDPGLASMLSSMDAIGGAFSGAIIIDDPVKPDDAESEIVRERVNERFESTIRSRLNSRDTPIVVVMQRLHEDDFTGYLTRTEPDAWTVVSLPAVEVAPDGSERALWPMKHDLDELRRLELINPYYFHTQYMQNPTPREGLMYPSFRTYRPGELPDSPRAARRCYVDTADTGSDFLCAVCFVDTPSAAYVTDVLYTDEDMEVTKPATARMLDRARVTDALVESNNGGREFAKRVKEILRADLGNFSCQVNWFTQTRNKDSRIFSASDGVRNDVLFPDGWERLWPKFHQALASYRKDNSGGRGSRHDDAPDAVTGVWEMHSRGARRRGVRRRN